MPLPTATFLDVILKKMKEKLIQDAIFQPGNVFIALNPLDSLKYPPNDQFCVISPGKQTINEHIRVGAGRTYVDVAGDIEVSLYNRLVLDQVPHEDGWLTNASLGSLSTLLAMINSIELYQPLDNQANQLLYKGFELQTIDKYSREGVSGQLGVGYGYITTTFEACYILNIAPTPQP